MWRRNITSIPGTFAISFTTPPTTRKRTAAEAAIDNEPLPAADRPPVTANPDQQSCKDYPTATVSESTDKLGSASSASRKKGFLGTPASTSASMDSDDDFMSDVSSNHFLDTQGSDDESLGEGTYLISHVYVYWKQRGWLTGDLGS